MGSDEEDKEKAEALNNSRLFDVHKWSNYPEVNAAVDQIFVEFKSLPDFAGKPKANKRHIKTLVIDLYDCWLEDHKMYIAYHRANSAYKAGSRYNELYISKLTPKVVDRLCKLGYLEHHIGHHDRTGTGSSHLSRMRATEKLIHLITKKYSWTPAVILRAPNIECIILRNKDKDGKRIDIEYPHTPETKRMRAFLIKYNNLLNKTHIDIPIAPIEGVESKSGSKKVKITQYDKFVRRIFNNGTFDDGGRFYGGWWQRISSSDRANIYIGDEPTIEIDYSGLHIVLLYALAGINYWEEVGTDPYEIPGLEKSKRMRELMKKILLVSVNAKDKVTALRAIRKAINFNKKDFGWVTDEGIDIDDILDQFVAKHDKIKDKFFSNAGINLQRLDSMIAEKIIDWFTEQGEVVLCVHDSIIAPERLAESLEIVMDNTFQATLFDLRIYMKVEPVEHEGHWHVRVKKGGGSGKIVISSEDEVAWKKRMDDFNDEVSDADYYKVDKIKKDE